MPEEAPHPKTHHECKCRECDPITALAERVDAWTCAFNLLKNGRELWGDDDRPGVHDVMVLADWLMYGPDGDED